MRFSRECGISRNKVYILYIILNVQIQTKLELKGNNENGERQEESMIESCVECVLLRTKEEQKMCIV